ncbi:MAG: hypothetical protein QOG50_3443, partial [Actinomycetota bacterium]|nr:hypothetical protein [Actinomycetota bacterium]
MFDALDDLETAIEKVMSSERELDVERMCRLSERVEFLKLRTIRDYELSGAWQADGFVSTASALRAKCRMVPGVAHAAVVLARKLEVLPETAAAFGAGEISRHHAEVIARAHTPERATMIENLDAQFANLACLTHAAQVRDEVKRITDAFDGDGGGADDAHQYALNKVTLSATLEGRGILNGSLDAELSRLVACAFDAELHALRQTGDPRSLPQRRAEALESMCRRTLDHHDDGTTRRRGHPHMIIVHNVNDLTAEHPDLVATIRREATLFGRLSATTLDRLCCDAKICRVITDGPSEILDVGRLTRTVPPAIWNALVARDRHCTAPGCTRSPEYCEAHHIWFWELGGPT